MIKTAAAPRSETKGAVHEHHRSFGPGTRTTGTPRNPPHRAAYGCRGGRLRPAAESRAGAPQPAAGPAVRPTHRRLLPRRRRGRLPARLAHPPRHRRRGGIVVVLAIGLHSLRDGVRRGLPRRTSSRGLARALAVVDAMDGPEFERHVAALCARDGCTDVRVDGGAGDLGADVTGYLPDGRLFVVQCKRYAPDRSVGSPDMQRFVGTARPVHGADAAVFVTSCRFTAPAAELALSQAIVLVDRDALRAWMRGTPLTTIVAAVPDLAPPPL
ncbi:restriction endonuclease [Yinghuangia aomiensis]